jgi:type III pantothenate kinase
MSTTFLSHSDPWIALSIGNSRLHWALFSQARLEQTCHTPHPGLDPPQNWSDWQQLCPFLAQDHIYPNLWVLSVVPSQTQLWQRYPRVTILECSDIPLQGIYPTLGVDRAIALWCAGITYGWPTLVIDGGTALTLTGADTQGWLVGGAILPGLSLQLRSLQSETAALPLLAALPDHLPQRWAKDTETAIQSGVIYGVLASLTSRIEQWLEQHPNTQIILTGGDASALASYLNQWHSSRGQLGWLQHVSLAPHLIWNGIAVLRYKKTQ